MSTNINAMAAPGGGDNLGDPTIGPHYARLVGFCYVGIHERLAYKGTPKDPCGKLLFTFELLDDFVEIDGAQRPRWVTKKENAFNTENANAVKIYNTLDPTNIYQGDFAQLALNTVPCMITIGPRKDTQGNPTTGTRVEAIGPMARAPDGSEYVLGPVQNPIVLFDFDAPTEESYGTLKVWMQKDVKAASNYPGSSCESVAQAFDAKASASAQSPQAAPPAAQAPPPAQGPAQTQQVPPAAQPAPAPAAPPGFMYDSATNSFVPEQQPPAMPKQQPPPAGGGAY